MRADDLSFLSLLPIFRGLPKDTLATLAEHIEEAEFAPGVAILKKGDPGDAMYILRAGSVQVPVDDERGQRRLTAYLGPGEFFGEMALVTGDARGADVIADGEIPVRAFVLKKPVVDELLKKNPRAARFLTEILGRRLLESGQIRHVGKYRLVGEIGRGGGAIVYDGYHPGLNRPVAVKMLAHDLVYEADFAERFRKEAQIIATLRHENVVEVFDTEQAFATFFIVMERLEGTELKHVIDDGPATPEEARHVLRQTARALHYAHRKGIVHQDVKPSNIFVESSGRVKLMDFGIAGAPVDGPSDASHGIMGTPGYIAPEALTGGSIDGRADIYALGVVAYEMLTGEPAFKATSKVEVLRDQLATPALTLPEELATRDPGLAAFVARATARDPNARYQDCRAVLEELDEPTGALDPRTVDGIALTVLFDRRDRDRVEAILGELGARLAELPGTLVTTGDLRAVNKD